MAAIHDLLEQVEDAPLRKRLREELDRLINEKTFGLVFEDHLPEVTLLHSAPVTAKSLVVRREGPYTRMYRVGSISKGVARCFDPVNGDRHEMRMKDLVVVRQFGDPIFPSLVHVDSVGNGSIDGPWHTLIEADNYHALQLLEYTCAGQADCIYIDPPYNTGASDWKYNNDYVDENDAWRHSKWLAMMRRRLERAKRLLNPSTGVLIATIDEHEVHHLGMLLKQVFPGAEQQMVTVVINQKGVAQGRLARTEEYAIFVFMPGAFLDGHHDDLLSPDRSAAKRFRTPRWEWLLRGGNNSRREDREGLFYPIYVDPTTKRITGVGEVLPLPKEPDLRKASQGTVAWPIRSNLSFGTWQVKPATLRELVSLGYVKLGGFDKKRNTWTVLYLYRGSRKRIESGEIRIVGRNPLTGAVDIEYSSQESRRLTLKTVWHRGLHDSGIYGSSILVDVLGGENKFSFPKSLYAVRDAIAAIVRNRPNALVVDFFAGSGTTLHALQLLNASDGGRRRCILVTNNEVSAAEAQELTKRGLAPGDLDWEEQGICRSITWPRVKYATRGRRDDRTALSGEYFTGRRIELEKATGVVQLSFADGRALSLKQKRQLCALTLKVKGPTIGEGPWFLADDCVGSILWDIDRASEWVAALVQADQVTEAYVVTLDGVAFKRIRTQILEAVPPRMVEVDERRPRSIGFQENIQYFRLDFLDKDDVALRRRFAEILPILWLRAGGVGPVPRPAKPVSAGWLIHEHGAFAVLLEEHRFAAFRAAIAKAAKLAHVFIVTDSDEAFHEMAGQIPHILCTQLYRDYLENFMINRKSD